MKSSIFTRQSLYTRLKGLRSAEGYWRYGSNLGPTLGHLLSDRTGFSDNTRAIVRELHKNGIATSRVEDLFDPALVNDLEKATNILIRSKSEEIRELKSKVDSDATIGQKTFNLELLGGEPLFQLDDPFAKIGLHASLLAIARNYLRMTAQLRYYNVWYTAASEGVSRESQLWHFDREDNYILKVFLYLDDVDLGTGPFTYAPGTHRMGIYRSLQPEFIMEGNVRRTTDEQMDKVYPREKWKACTGRKGTVIFADTRGYHKGGEARAKDRLMFTCMYTSPASQSKDLIRFPQDFDPAKLSREQIRALRIPRK
ncbi:MAG TPA: phytanoyl-CoA dioxygenase family protein [Pyrinomonadaceae bacterium]